MPVATAQTELSVRDHKLHSGLRRGITAINRYGARVGAAMKTAVYSILAVGAAVAGVAALTLRAWMKQETAVNDLSAALEANGDDAESLIPKYKEFASAIQAVTTMGDEAVLTMMAQMRNLGIMPENLEAATKGAIGLAKALNMDSNSAARYTALALQGETTILRRYVPALRTAKNAAEEQAIVQDLMNKGFEQAQAETNTLSGRMTQLWNAIGDVAEGIGEVLAPYMESSIETLSMLTAYIQQNMTQIREWVSDLLYVGKVVGEWLVEKIIWFAEKTIWAFTFVEQAIRNWRTMLDWVLAVAMYPIVKFVNQVTYYFTEVVPANLKYLGNVFQSVFHNITEFLGVALGNLWANITDFFKNLWKKVKGEDVDWRWTGLLDGAEFTVAEMTTIAERIPGEIEEALKMRMAETGAELGEAIGSAAEARIEKLHGLIEGISGAVTRDEARAAARARLDIGPATMSAGKSERKKDVKASFEGLAESWKRITQAASTSDPSREAIENTARAATKTARTTERAVAVAQKSERTLTDIYNLLLTMRGQAGVVGVYGV